MPFAGCKKLSNSKKIPILGLNTCQGYFNKASNTEEIVKAAIDAGYRLFDCASMYNNEKEIGQALKDKIAEKVVKRKELFIITKVWNTDHRPHYVVESLKSSLRALNLDNVDLYLMHWPFAHSNTVDFLETWQIMERCVESKLTKSIGLSNFNSEQINRIMEIAKIKPVVNQVECHINLNQKKLREFCKERNIALMGYCPFGDANTPYDGPYSGWKSSEVISMDAPEIETLSANYQRSNHQIVLRYLTQLGIITTPRSSSKKHIIENMEIFDFQLKSDEIERIDRLDCGKRIYTASQFEKFKYYPFKIDF